MKLFVSILLFAVLTVTSSSKAESPRRILLKSTDGVELTISYSPTLLPFEGCYKCPRYWIASDLQIVAGGKVSNKADITIVLKNWRYHKLMQRTQLEVAKYRMQNENGRLVVRIGASRFHDGYMLKGLPIHETGYTGDADYWQQISFVVNGRWQQDPINLTNDFNFVMY